MSEDERNADEENWCTSDEEKPWALHKEIKEIIQGDKPVITKEEKDSIMKKFIAPEDWKVKLSMVNPEFMNMLAGSQRSRDKELQIEEGRLLDILLLAVTAANYIRITTELERKFIYRIMIDLIKIVMYDHNNVVATRKRILYKALGGAMLPKEVGNKGVTCLMNEDEAKMIRRRMKSRPRWRREKRPSGQRKAYPKTKKSSAGNEPQRGEKN
eukprot:TRINITY_DN1824_c0_g1_i1.p2 TRINITY_DN1824_c0_g1~~TRINITY_DN1824_c0_g1_i1.p2  ORF type:complete len:213 (+),score=29.27 TRINITY_DN1824_c0_g1_i1:138-776(+)